MRDCLSSLQQDIRDGTLVRTAPSKHTVALADWDSDSESSDGDEYINLGGPALTEDGGRTGWGTGSDDSFEFNVTTVPSRKHPKSTISDFSPRRGPSPGDHLAYRTSKSDKSK